MVSAATHGRGNLLRRHDGQSSPFGRSPTALRRSFEVVEPRHLNKLSIVLARTFHRRPTILHERLGRCVEPAKAYLRRKNRRRDGGARAGAATNVGMPASE